MEKYCVSPQKAGARGFWRLISGLIWYITPHIGADLPKKKYQSVWLAVPSDFISFTL